MRLSDIEKKARGMGIADTWRYSKTELIRQIQRKEGNSPCFGRANGHCPNLGCCWIVDCLR